MHHYLKVYYKIAIYVGELKFNKKKFKDSIIFSML